MRTKQRLYFLLLMTVLCSCDLMLKQAPTSPQVYVAPVSKPSGVDPLDSAYLRIKFVPNGYEISLFDKFRATGQTTVLDSFIVVNKAQLDKNKIVIISHDTADFKHIRSLLLKHAFTKVRVQED